MNLTKHPKKQTRASLKKGDTVAGACPIPGFESVFFADDIDWTEHDGTSISEETAQALVGVVSPSTVQAAADANGGKVVEAWRLQRTKPETGKGIDWDSVPIGSAPDMQIGKILGVANTAVAAARRVRGVPRFKKGDAARRAAVNLQSKAKARIRKRTATIEAYRGTTPIIECAARCGALWCLSLVPMWGSKPRLYCSKECRLTHPSEAGK